MRFPYPLVLALILSTAACGGRQSSGDGEGNADCRAPSERMGAADLEEAVLCLEARGRAADDIEGTPSDAALCRGAAAWSAAMTDDAVAAMVRCTLVDTERADGAWLAELLAAAADNGDRTRAIVEAMPGFFSAELHGNSFSVALTRGAQEQIAAQLPALSPEARSEMVSIAIGYQLDPLAGAASPYVRELPADDPAVAVWARQQAASGDAVSEGGRWALAATGEWTAADLIRCYRGDQAGCEGWEGESPLALIADIEGEPGHQAAPREALRLLRGGDLDEASVAGVTHLIAGLEYDDRPEMLGTLLNDMTASDVDDRTRGAIARAATPAMCDYGVVVTYLLRAMNSDPDRWEDASTPWPSFIAACLERHWGAGDLAGAAGAGSWLGAPRDVYAGVQGALGHALADMTCADVQAAAATAAQWNHFLPMRGLAWTTAAQQTGDRCAAELGGEIRAIVSDDDAHPEARLTGATWLVSQGDRSGCGIIDSALRWYHPEYEMDAGPWAAEIAEDLREACQ